MSSLLPIRALLSIALSSAALCAEDARSSISYNDDIRPILAAKCFHCHGPDKAQRKAGLRLDVEHEAYADRDGVRAIVPSDAASSALIARILSSNPDEIMPPPSEAGTLTQEEKDRLKRWVDEGAKYQRHWAFVEPVRSSVPLGEWGQNSVDRFIGETLRSVGLSPQKRASRERLIRRLSFDLTGLPPTLDEVDSFLEDRSQLAYESLVNRLLDSPRYGERMAQWWLDGARYGDSHGYDNDLENSQWPWRNWVVEAFNSNKPFDEFTIEQLAGDLLPGATNAQVIATGFNRNHRIQTEGGAIDEEWRTEYVIDRVDTMGTVWLGLTLGCARCHDHKYDPISQKEFYQLFALFNNLDEKGFINNLRGSAEPRVRYRSMDYEREVKTIRERVDKTIDREKQLKQLDARYPTVMIMREMKKPRRSFVLKRGQYDAPDEEVQAALPTAIGPLSSELDAQPSGKTTRLDLARWLVSGRHPLTARVMVNRLWEQIFGTGLVESSENLGVQADKPSHPELLDWLAVEFVDSGWNIKSIVKLLVMSETYRQSSSLDDKTQNLDPKNRLLSRGPRIRLHAEMIRDQALAVSGLLVDRIGGPSVKPYQPEGLWKDIEKRGTFQRDTGEKLYRRSLYTTVRRTVAHPGMLLFDMPSREVCTVRRARTNTPLQALVLMNAESYVEAAKKFAERSMLAGSTAAQRIAWAFRRATSRHASQTESHILLQGYERRRARFLENPDLARALLDHGESRIHGDYDLIDLAAMTTVTNVLLNLDETINK